MFDLVPSKVEATTCAYLPIYLLTYLHVRWSKLEAATNGVRLSKAATHFIRHVLQRDVGRHVAPS